MGRKITRGMLAVLVAAAFCSCAKQHQVRTVMPRGLDSYAFRQTVGGIVIAAEPYASAEKARSAFSVNVTRKGYLPVLVVLVNQSEDRPGATRLIRKNRFQLVDRTGIAYSPVSGIEIAKAMIAGSAHGHDDDFTKELEEVARGEGGSDLDVYKANVEREEPDFDTSSLLDGLGSSLLGGITSSLLDRLGISVFSTAENRRKRLEQMQDDFRSKELHDSVFLNPGRQESGFVYFKVPAPHKFSGTLRTWLYEADGEGGDPIEIPIAS